MQRCVALGLCWRRERGGAEGLDENGKVCRQEAGFGGRGREEMIRGGRGLIGGRG